MAKGQELSDDEMAWLIAWNVAAGYWSRAGLTPMEAKKLMFDFARILQSDAVEAVKQTCVQLQQASMALSRRGFEEIQDEAQFRQHAHQNLLRLLSAYQKAGDSGIATAWHEVFPGDREVPPVTYQPIRIIENDGESKETALEVVGAPDMETRVAAEWWYLRYRFGRNWRPGMHMSTIPDANGDRFSIHNIGLPEGSHKESTFGRLAAVRRPVLNSRHWDIEQVADYVQSSANCQRVDFSGCWYGTSPQGSGSESVSIRQRQRNT